ncbi:hypothetical protein J2W17_003652 [Pseudomonas lini]|uniref:hypothetical protein n=1 Tax=Pseudomonas lini TaxID=163011 RepID=UPI002780013C|nr:hypothetical protein [Pseudomonas lini]MDQ0124698.1 hypothetical protein [Pseudomonas lini]
MSYLSELQAVEIAKLQALGAAWHLFHHGSKTDRVPTDSGDIPTLSGLGEIVLEAMGGVLLPVVETIEAAGVAQALDIETARRVSAFDITLTAPVCVLSLLNEQVPAGFQSAITLTLRQGTGANKVTWPSNVVWQFNRPPVLAYVQGMSDMVTLVSDPVTSKWRGMVDGGWFNV